MEASKIGIYLPSLRSAVGGDLKHALAKAAELGFKGINLGFGGSSDTLSPDDKLSLLRDYAPGLGLTITALQGGLSHGTEGSVAERTAPLREMVDLAAASGVPIAVVHGGERTTLDEDQNRAAWRRLLEELRFGVRYAADHGVRVAMEPGGGIWQVHGWRLLARLRQEVGEQFNVNLDPANVVMVCEDPVEGVRVLKDAIIHMHIKDARLSTPAPDAHAFVATLDDTASQIRFADWTAVVQKENAAAGGRFYHEAPVGTGQVDFAALMKALAAVGFDGWMCIEREGRSVPLADILAARDHVAACL